MTGWQITLATLTVLVAAGSIAVGLITALRSKNTPADPLSAAQPSVLYHLSGYDKTADEARAACVALNGVVATREQVRAAHAAGDASWCSFGWTTDANGAVTNMAYPHAVDMPEYSILGCGASALIEFETPPDPSERYGVNCYGPPPADLTGVYIGRQDPSESYTEVTDVVVKSAARKERSAADIWECSVQCDTYPNCTAFTYQEGECYVYPRGRTRVADQIGATAYIRYADLPTYHL